MPQAQTKFVSNQRGFTLPELMIVIVLLGILAAIAIPSWFGMIEERRVETAANQLASDLRLAHSRASNQVGTEWEVTLNPTSDPSADYILKSKPPDPSTPSKTENKSLPGNVDISFPTGVSVLTFNSYGAVTCLITPNCKIEVKSGDSDRTLTISPATSDVEVSDD